jgi:hypothetical protein
MSAPAVWDAHRHLGALPSHSFYRSPPVIPASAINEPCRQGAAKDDRIRAALRTSARPGDAARTEAAPLGRHGGRGGPGAGGRRSLRALASGPTGRGMGS